MSRPARCQARGPPHRPRHSPHRCALLAAVPVMGRCPAGATAVAFPAGAFGPNGGLGLTDTAGVTWPAANVPASRLDALGVDAITVATDGATAAVEQART